MPQRIIRYFRANIVAFLALFLAVGGTSYAAVGFANHSIDPVKLNPRNLGGYVRAWVSVASNGPVTASGGGVRVQRDFNIAPGHYIIDWHPRPTSSCSAMGSVGIGLGSGPAPGYVVAGTGYSRGRGEQSAVQVYNAQGQATALPYDLELVCATPRRR